jgi:hypothetical protein
VGAVSEVLSARLERLQNLVVKYDCEETYTPPSSLTRMSTAMIEGHPVHIITTPQSTSEELWFRDGQVRHERRLSEASLRDAKEGNVLDTEFSVTVFARDHIERLQKHANYNFLLGRIADTELMPEMVIDYGLGLRQTDTTNWLTSEDVKSSDIVVAQTGEVVLRRTDALNGLHEWTFDPQQGYALTSYKVRTPPPRKVGFEVLNSKFENVEGLMLPKRVEKRHYYEEDGETKVSQTTVLTVREYQLGDPNNTDAKYRIQWPEGTHVLDARLGVRYRAGKGGKLSERETHRDEVIRDFPNGGRWTGEESGTEANPVVAGKPKMPTTRQKSAHGAGPVSGQTGGIPWPLVIAGLVVLVGGGAVFVFRGRRESKKTPQ